MDIAEYLRFALALVFVLALIAVLAALARRAGLGFPAKAMRPGGARRLAVIEVTPLDSRRRLVLIRRDGVEHLVILSPNSETVIETGIAPAPGFAEELERTKHSDAQELEDRP